MNPFFNSYQENRQGGNGQGMDLNSILQNALRTIMPTGMTAEQIVRQNIQNGNWDSQKFNQFAQIADRLTGGRR